MRYGLATLAVLIAPLLTTGHALPGTPAVSVSSSLEPPAKILAAQTNGIPMPPQGIYVFGINSPHIQLTPTVLGPPSQTWNMSYSNISAASFVPGMISLGQASYVTSLQGTGGATLTFQFVGTGVSLLGSAGFFDVFDWRVDGVPYNPDGSASSNQNAGFGWEAEVAWVRDLPWGLHTCTFVVQTTYDKVVLYEVMVLTGIEGAVLTDSPTDTLRQIEPAVDGVRSPSTHFNTTGRWEVYTPNEGDAVSRQAFPSSGYTVLRTNVTASLHYVLPKRTAYVEVWESTGWGFANYTVTLTPSPPLNPPVITYSANTAYYVPAYILSWAILDPNVDYVLEFQSYGGWSEVYNIQYFLANETSPTVDTGKSSGVSVAALAGGIAGAFIAGVFVCALAALALFRSYKKKQPSQPVFEVDHSHDARPEPFYHSPGAPGPELVPLMSEMQGYGDGVLGLNAAASASNRAVDMSPVSPASPVRSGRAGTDDASSSSGGASRHSSRHTGPSMHVTNDAFAPATFKSPRNSSAVPEHRNRGSAPAPLPLTEQERDSGAQVIHIVEYVPPAYDDNLRATTSGSTRGDVTDDPAKPGGVRPLPTTPN
ncbi:uncharacterized protein LOC62_06G007899 [Vanrija pseudolonga]|uniref:Transmembrane protein n=1 Tax=Vanrija pseudolonga TaxID=143232 RepID=A0AAF0YGV8_9TREE|nr:hypothetical protein LOC62_06G007899 [Vanrija pseudolonga]